MTRNVVICFLQNLTSSKKSNQLPASSSSNTKDAMTLADVVKKPTKKSKKCEHFDKKIEQIVSKTTAVNGKLSKKKPSTAKRKFFLRKSR